MVLEGVSFTHERGALGIAGPNGSGKSTLLKCLAGLVKPTSGSVQWTQDQDDIELRQHLGYAAPYIQYYPELTCRENLHFLARMRRLDFSADIPNKLLDEVHLAGRADQAYGSLSTGQQQRFRLAALLLYRPRIIMLDEPGSNLDAEGRAMVQQLVERFVNENRLVLLASNQAEELAWCDRTLSVNARYD